jgi:hypothetical protein
MLQVTQGINCSLLRVRVLYKRFCCVCLAFDEFIEALEGDAMETSVF